MHPGVEGEPTAAAQDLLVRALALRRHWRPAAALAAVMAYLAGIIEGADPIQQDGRTDVTVREMLERAHPGTIPATAY